MRGYRGGSEKKNVTMKQLVIYFPHLKVTSDMFLSSFDFQLLWKASGGGIP